MAHRFESNAYIFFSRNIDSLSSPIWSNYCRKLEVHTFRFLKQQFVKTDVQTRANSMKWWATTSELEDKTRISECALARTLSRGWSSNSDIHRRFLNYEICTAYERLRMRGIYHVSPRISFCHVMIVIYNACAARVVSSDAKQSDNHGRSCHNIYCTCCRST